MSSSVSWWGDFLPDDFLEAHRDDGIGAQVEGGAVFSEDYPRYGGGGDVGLRPKHGLPCSSEDYPRYGGG